MGIGRQSLDSSPPPADLNRHQQLLQVLASFAEAPVATDARSRQRVDDAWRKTLDDPVLESLLKQALESAPDIAAAQARVREARALSGFAQSDLRNPAGRVSAQATRRRSAGSGRRCGARDGTAFIAAVSRSGGTAGQAGIQALRRYNEVRLAPNRKRVLESLAETKELLGSTKAR